MDFVGNSNQQIALVVDDTDVPGFLDAIAFTSNAQDFGIIVKSGDPAPDTEKVLTGLSIEGVTDHGGVIFGAQLVDDPAASSRDFSLWEWTPEGPKLIFKDGDTNPHGEEFDFTFTPTVSSNSHGLVVIQGQSGTQSQLWGRGAPDGLLLLAQEGDIDLSVKVD